ncbi:hypothetical protein NLI96_g7327 [Meripilus lineatus]|uniref:Mid2 domain-containing protein n=1 Tax=Meripilus lineatus TaxID=2056292 RepID=A0AAD5UZ94_9APHY|nr:hypothetical protein NLI96_g7327 [Physisporinus lineatus]
MESCLGLRVLLLTSSFLIPHSLGILVNRTIDDQYGDWSTGSQVQYTPDRAWVQGSSCRATPSAQQAHNGTAIYIFTIAVQSTTAEVNFTIDGVPHGHYNQTYDMPEAFQYDVPVFSMNDLTHGAHILTVDLPDYTRVNQTTFVFDYAIYSTDADPNASPTSTDTPSSLSPSTEQASSSGRKTNVTLGAIIGGVIGGITLLAAIISAVLFWCRQRKRFLDTETQEESHVTPFQVSELNAPAFAPDTSPGPSAPQGEVPTSSEGPMNPLEKEIAALREEVAQLRANQTQAQVASPSRQHSVGESLKQLVASLRAEVDQLRANQELSRDDLPTYSELQ